MLCRITSKIFNWQDSQHASNAYTASNVLLGEQRSSASLLT